MVGGYDAQMSIFPGFESSDRSTDIAFDVHIHPKEADKRTVRFDQLRNQFGDGGELRDGDVYVFAIRATWTVDKRLGPGVWPLFLVHRTWESTLRKVQRSSVTASHCSQTMRAPHL